MLKIQDHESCRDTSIPTSFGWNAGNALDTSYLSGPRYGSLTVIIISLDAIQSLKSVMHYTTFPAKSESIKEWHPTKTASLSLVLRPETVQIICCDMDLHDTIGKIELFPLIVLSTRVTN